MKRITRIDARAISHIKQLERMGFSVSIRPTRKAPDIYFTRKVRL